MKMDDKQAETNISLINSIRAKFNKRVCEINDDLLAIDDCFNNLANLLADMIANRHKL